MFFNYLYRKFGVEVLEKPVRTLFGKYLFLASSLRSIQLLSDTFNVLFYINLLGYIGAAQIFGIGQLINALLDYPTGILSDKLGQKAILIASVSSYAISYFFLSTATNYSELLIAATFFAIGSSQQSGALETWFDNNYRSKTEKSDSDRAIYRGIIARFRVIVDLCGGVMIVVGGIIATTFSRNLVFQIQVILMLLISVMIFFFVRNFPEVKSSVNYKSMRFLAGLRTVLKSKVLIFIVIAEVFYFASLMTYGTLLLFPIYFGFTGTDAGASLFRFVLFVVGSVILWAIAYRIRRMNLKVMFVVFHILHTLIFYLGMFFLLIVFPIRDELNWVAILWFGMLIAITHTMRVIINIFLQSIILDLIPDKVRNEIYSLVPSCAFLVGAPLVLVSGTVIESWTAIQFSIVPNIEFVITGQAILMLFLGAIAVISTLIYIFIIPVYIKNKDKIKQSVV